MHRRPGFRRRLFCSWTCVLGWISCVPHIEPCMSRAAWAVVQVDQHGDIIRAILGVVPAELPQTAQAAEFAAGLAFSKFADTGSILLSDCSSVVKSFRARLQAKWAKMVHGGSVRAAFQQPKVSANLQVTVKIKAHQDTQAMDPQDPDRTHALGNVRADELANRAISLHPRSDPSTWRNAEFVIEEAMRVGSLLAKASARWPAAGGRRIFSEGATEAKQRAAARRREARQEEAIVQEQRRSACIGSHQWQTWRSTEKCSACLVTRARGALQPCTGGSSKLLKALSTAVASGHQIWVGDHIDPTGAAVPFAACTRCGGWTESGRSGKLAATCAAPRGAGPYALRRLQQGRHPTADSRSADHVISNLAPWVPQRERPE